MIGYRYKNKGIIGQGGMGMVYLVEDSLKNNMRLALKMIKQNILSRHKILGIESFKREYDIMTRLKHPNLTRVYDFGQEKDKYFIVMEYLEGMVLSEYVKHKRPEPDIVLNVLIQLLRALGYIHSRNIVYRDIKPNNIMIVPNSVKLMDFGLSGFTKDNEKRVRGTILYMPPELLCGISGPFGDIFSLGMVMYEVFSGSPFYDKEKMDLSNIVTLLRDKEKFEAYKANKLKAIDGDIKALVCEMTVYDHRDRPQYASDVIDSVNRIFNRKYDYETKETRTCYVLGNTFADRKDELNGLIMALKNKKHVNLLNGPDGSGKSRLFTEFRKYCSLNGIKFFEADCIEGRADEYYALKDIISAMIAYSEGPLLNKYGQFIKHILPGHNMLKKFNITDIKDNPKLLKDMVIQNISDFILGLSKGLENDLVIYFNDLQWIDDGSADMLDHLIYRIGQSQVDNLYIYANINEYKRNVNQRLLDQLMSHGIGRTDLPPLCRDGVHEYIHNIFGHGRTDKRLTTSIDKIRELTGGNPLFLENLIKSLIDLNIIIKDGSRWSLTRDIEEIDVPNNLKDLIRKRLSNVMKNKDHAKLLQIMSLLRLAPDMDILRSFQKEEINDHILELEKNEVLLSTNTENVIRYSFASSIMKDIIRENIKEGTKISLFIAGSLERIANDELIDEIAYHYHRGEDIGKAIHYYKISAETAYNNYFNEKAVSYYNVLLGLISNEEEKLDIMQKKAMALNETADWENASAILKEAIGLSQKIKSIERECEASILLANILFLRGSVKGSGKLTDRSHILAQATGDEVLLARAYIQKGTYYYNLSDYKNALSLYHKAEALLKKYKNKYYAAVLGNIGNVYYMKAEYSKAIKIHMKFLDLALRNRDKRAVAKARGNIGTCYAMLDQYDKCLDFLTKSLKNTRETGDKRGIALAENNIGIVYLKQYKYKEALKHYNKSLKILEEIGFKEGIGKVTGNIGIIYFEMGNYDKALKYYRTYLKFSEELGDRNGISIAIGNIGNIYYNQGHHDKALKFYKKKYEVSKSINDRRGTGIALWGMGNVLFYLNDFERAIDHYVRGIKILKQLDLEKPFLIEYLFNKAEIHICQGRSEQALKVNKKAKEIIDTQSQYKKIYIQEYSIIAKKDKKKALEQLQRIVKEDISEEIKSKAYHEMFKITRTEEHRKKAIVHYREAYREKPFYIYKQMADALMKL